MKNPFKTGDQKTFECEVTTENIASFENEGVVHAVYSTFALGQDVEWACRLFVLEMLEEGEQGIGTYLSVNHRYPAPLKSKVKIVASLEYVKKNVVHCSYEAFANGLLIADGEQTQKIIKMDRFNELLASIEIS